uniref:Receptor-like serine/threonine-protein kinase n=1 Tax=Kalanchoe fedtschenkoi TaxID=63787 RepID=A0A7N0UPN8_KALFE
MAVPFSLCRPAVLGLALLILECGCSLASEIPLGSKLVAGQDASWVSDNGTFAFGFSPDINSRNQFQLTIWFHQLPGDRTVVWSANRNYPVNKGAVLELDSSGNLVLTDQRTTVWTSNTSGRGVTRAAMLDSGNFLLYGINDSPIWQSFSHPSDTLLPNQPLSASLELTSTVSHSRGGYYSLKMLQQRTSLSLGLTYSLPELSEKHFSNYSYWSGPEISNVTGDIVAILDDAGSFGIMYGESFIGAVYVYKNDGDNGSLSSNVNQNRSTSPSTLRRLTLETNGNLRLYRWDNDLNGTRQWVPEWAAVSSPCDIAGTCGNGICSLDRSKTNVSCKCLPGTSKDGNEGQCFADKSLAANCDSQHGSPKSEYKIQVVQQTNYYFSDSSVIANYSDVRTLSSCGDACLTACECVASVYGLREEKPYCWVLRSLEYGGFEDTASTLFLKVSDKGSYNPGNTRHSGDSSGGSSRHEKIMVIPIVLSMALLIALLCFLLYYSLNKRRTLRRAMESSQIFSGAPMNFTYRDLQHRTANFSQLLGTGGFGSVYKGSLGDGTLVAVKKLDRMLPHGQKEFITEVNTIGSMHHMNLVRLCGYCSEGSQRLLVYEFMKNGSLDKWIFPSFKSRDRFLDWPTRFRIAIATAQGIAYFHEQCRDRIIHCDIKPENILLDENFNAKVSDFGLAKMMGREHSQVVTMIRGTRGYVAPEWVSNRPITVKADVFSYGMLLLEIVGGRRNLDMSFDAEEFFFPGWAYKELTTGSPKNVADRRLEWAVEETELIRALKVGFWCIQDEVVLRPSMGEVVKMLEGSIEVQMPPMPQTVEEIIEEGLEHVYKAMKREFNHLSSASSNLNPSTSNATFSCSSMSPR